MHPTSLPMAWLAACALWVAACDLGGVPPPAPPNYLGQVCDTATPCPENPPHLCVILSIGSQSQGYCSPMCTVDDECRAGYTGPASGTAYCLNPGTSDTCTIQCTSPAGCPTGLDCVSSGGPASFCVVPAQSLQPGVKTRG